MSTLSGFPYCDVQFDKDGNVHDQGEVDALLEMLGQEVATDLIVISHGWNNDIPAARALYSGFLASLRGALDFQQPVPTVLSGRRIAVMGVLWPSQKFAESDVIASGAASLDEDGDVRIQAALRTLQEALGDRQGADALATARRLVSRLENDPVARQRFADTVRGVLPGGAANDEDASTEFFRLRGEEVMERLRKPIPLSVPSAASPAGAGGADSIGSLAGPPPGFGKAASLGSLFADARAAALRLVNYSTYYLMKQRAGTVGRVGASSVLRDVQARFPDVKLHLVGHSFGGRLVTSVAEGAADPPPLKLQSMTLLQAAFSHHGFAQRFDGTRDGVFRRVIADHLVTGPILVTHTPNDTAVGMLYPLASLLAGDDAAALGDRNDPFGGIGRNGAQKTPEAVSGSLLPLGSPYQLQAGSLHNLEASAFIKDHSDVVGEEVAWAVLTALGTT